jgi:hypothetical protein
LAFANGYKLSVQFGLRDYCERRFSEEKTDNVVSQDAEIAIIRNDKLIQLSEYDSVIGYASVENVTKIAGFLASFSESSEDSDKVVFDFIQGLSL